MIGGRCRLATARSAGRRRQLCMDKVVHTVRYLVHSLWRATTGRWYPLSDLIAPHRDGICGCQHGFLSPEEQLPHHLPIFPLCCEHVSRWAETGVEVVRSTPACAINRSIPRIGKVQGCGDPPSHLQARGRQASGLSTLVFTLRVSHVTLRICWRSERPNLMGAAEI